MALVRILVDGYSLLHSWPELAAGAFCCCSNSGGVFVGLVPACEVLPLLASVVPAPGVNLEVTISRLDVLANSGPIFTYGFHGFFAVWPPKHIGSLFEKF